MIIAIEIFDQIIAFIDMFADHYNFIYNSCDKISLETKIWINLKNLKGLTTKINI
jgi:hypothetical protein